MKGKGWHAKFVNLKLFWKILIKGADKTKEA